MPNLVTLIFSILAGSIGALLIKMGAMSVGPLEIKSTSDILNFFIKIFLNITILSGMGLYFASALLWTYLLTKLDISYVQPILALTYVVTPILAIFFLDEKVPVMRWLGILVIIIGVFIVSRTTVQ